MRVSAEEIILTDYTRLQANANELFRYVSENDPTLQMGQDEGLEEIGTMEALLGKMTRIISHLSLGNEGSNFVNKIVEEQGVDDDTLHYLQEISGNLRTHIASTGPYGKQPDCSSPGKPSAQSRLTTTKEVHDRLQEALSSCSYMMPRIESWHVKTLSMQGTYLCNGGRPE